MNLLDLIIYSVGYKYDKNFETPTLNTYLSLIGGEKQHFCYVEPKNRSLLHPQGLVRYGRLCWKVAKGMEIGVVMVNPLDFKTPASLS